MATRTMKTEPVWHEVYNNLGSATVLAGVRIPSGQVGRIDTTKLKPGEVSEMAKWEAARKIATRPAPSAPATPPVAPSAPADVPPLDFPSAPMAPPRAPSPPAPPVPPSVPMAPPVPPRT